MQMQVPSVETRVASLEVVQSQINERLGSIEQGQRERFASIEQGQRERFASIEQGQRERFASIENRLAALENRQASNFRWLIGIIISTQLTTLLTLGSLILVKLG